MKFRDFFDTEDYALFDGAMGTQTYARGIPKGHCYDELNISMPEVVMDIHRSYIEAGAKVITTNTFGANKYILDEYYAIGKKTREINYYGARLAKRAAKNRAWIAGSVGPISRPLDKKKKISSGDISSVMKEQIEALLEGGVDLIIFETFAHMDELLEGIKVARSVEKDVFVIAEMSFPNNGLTLFGKNPYEVGLKLDSSSADVIGSNCGAGPQNVYEAVKKMGKISSKDLSAMPNAGLAQFVQGKFFYPFNPTYFAKYGKKFLEAGVKIIGGCCGTTPDHIRKLSQFCEGLKPRKRKTVSIELSERKEIRKKEKITCNLKRILKKGGLVALEIDPPKDPDFEKFIKTIEPYVHSVDAINVSDSPMARPRMSSIATGKLLKESLGNDVIIHYTCRDRNILGIQADLLGASALGLENFLVLGGDPPSIGDYPFATGVYDLTTEGLVEMMSAMNHGIDLLGNPVGKCTRFFIGIGMGICEEEEKNWKIARQKIKKGGHFIITQPVFDIKRAKKTLNSIKEAGIPVIVSILPLISSRNAEYIHYEVPGITIPPIFLKKMDMKRGREGEKEGVAIAKEIIKELKPFANGVLFMPPLGKFYLVEEILS